MLPSTPAQFTQSLLAAASGGRFIGVCVSNPTDSCVSAVKIVIKRANPDGGVGHAIRVII
jgi:hypothetical protein